MHLKIQLAALEIRYQVPRVERPLFSHSLAIIECAMHLCPSCCSDGWPSAEALHPLSNQTAAF